ncbi:hypothetical protein [Sphingopyxis sp.]|jgi:hypothetical protein|uniref:hypothetical protein n=1 Tax=Sphingopyxis sp. TaxID=1908224 RepID=UPI003F724EC9
MGCETVQLDNGARAIVCSPGRTKRCACGKRADRLCDWKVKTRRSGTCDTPICRACSHEPAPGKDLCPAHREVWLSRTLVPERTT